MKANFEKGTKICSKCKRELPISHFQKDKSKSDGLNTQCKDCVTKYRKSPKGKEVASRARRKYYQTEKGKECQRRVDQKRFQNEEFKTKAKIRAKNYYERTKPEPKRIERMIKINEDGVEVLNCLNCNRILPVTQFYKDCYQKTGYDCWCKDCRRELQIRRLNTEEGKEYNRIQAKKYRQTEKGKEHVRTYNNEKFKQDIDFKIAKLLRNRILRVLKGNIKSGHTLNLLGCSIDELKAHLEMQFEPGMTWENQGGKDGWQIDHIIPCAKFNLSIPECQRICFNYRNLQPMWAKENNIKKDSLPNGWEELLRIIKEDLSIDIVVNLKES